MIRTGGPRVLLAVAFPYPPGLDLGLAYLATALRRAGYDVKILEIVPRDTSPAAFAQLLRRRPLALLGLKVWTPALAECRRYLQAAHEALPELPVVLGGPHCTATGTKVLQQFQQVAYAFFGEAEIGLPLLVQEILRRGPDRKSVLSQIPGLLWQWRGEPQANPQAFPEDLDSLGDPAWDLLDFQQYHDRTRNGTYYYPTQGSRLGDAVCVRVFGKRQRNRGLPNSSLPQLNPDWIHVQATRGCPNHCTYCLAPKLAGHQVRKHSPEAVARQLKTLRDQHGVTHFAFADDNLTRDRGFALSLFASLEPLGLTWGCDSNGVEFRTLDGEVVQAMVRAGCNAIILGVESGSERVLRAMGRRYTRQEVRAAVDRIRAAAPDSLWLSAYLLFGYPDETDRDVLETMTLALSLDLDRISVHAFTPWPGIPITRTLERTGRLPGVETDTYHYGTATIDTLGLPRWRANLYRYLLYALFCGQPRRLRRHLRLFGIRTFAFEVFRFCWKQLSSFHSS